MSDHEALCRRVRRLMWAYPRWYRRERGPEIVTTLLDDAAPGQRRPARADAIDLILGGAGMRLRPPRGAGAYAATAVVALYLAVAGAAVASWASGATGPPSEEQAIAAAMAAVPYRPHNVPGPPVKCDDQCPEWDRKDDVVAIQAPFDHTDRTLVWLPLSPDELSTLMAPAANRLRAAGWQVEQEGDPAPNRDGSVRPLQASKDGMEISVQNTSTTVVVVVSKGLTVTAVAFVTIGSLGGLLIGQMVAVWALHRYRRHRLLRRSLVVVAAIPFLVIVPLIIAIVAMIVASQAENGLGSRLLKTPFLVLPGSWPFTLAIVVSSLTALALTALPGPPRVSHSTPRYPRIIAVAICLGVVVVQWAWESWPLPIWMGRLLALAAGVTGLLLGTSIIRGRRES